MSNRTHQGASVLIPVTLDQTHAAVVECINALDQVLVSVRPSGRNLSGYVDYVEGGRRLKSLHSTLAVFPGGRIPNDPFTSPTGKGLVTLTIPTYEGVTEGTSRHDTAIRFVAGINNTLRVGRRFPDPNTGQTLYLPEWPNAGYLPPDENGDRVWVSGGRYENPHYSVQDWGEDLWEKLFQTLHEHAVALLPGGHLARLLVFLEVEYNAVRNRIAAQGVMTKPCGRDDQAKGAKKTKKPNKEQTAAIVEKWFRDNRERVEGDPSKITLDVIAEETGTWRVHVCKSPMWVLFEKRRKSTRPRKGKPARPMNDKMAAVIPSPVVIPEELAELIEEQEREAAQDERRTRRKSA